MRPCFPLLQGGGALVLALGILAGLLWYDAPVALAAAGLLAILFLLANCCSCADAEARRGRSSAMASRSGSPRCRTMSERCAN